MALKPLEELNREFCEKTPAFARSAANGVKAPRLEKKRRAFNRISDTVFFAVTALLLVMSLISGNSSGKAKRFLGYSCFTVTSRSMQDEIPKGSLIVVKETDPQSLNIGDTVTYMRDINTAVTHKIIGIQENGDGCGKRGFSTMGVNNAQPDPEVVCADKIIGAVRFSVPVLGFAFAFAADNIKPICLVFGIAAAAAAVKRRAGKTGKENGYTVIGQGGKHAADR